MECRHCPSRVSRCLLVFEFQGRYGSPTSSFLFVRLCRTATHSSCRHPTGETIADPEATLYAGSTIIVLTAQVEQFGFDDLALLEAELGSEDSDIPDALTKAADYIEIGL